MPPSSETSPRLTFWFDPISPYAYFAWIRVRDIAQRNGASLRLQPVLFAAILDHHGQLGPAEIPAKRQHTFKDIARYAAERGIELTGPATHPFNPLTALRLCLCEVSGDQQARVIDAVFRAGWGRGIDLGNPDALRACLDAAGLDGSALLASTRDPHVKEALKAATAEAIAAGVFGVPTVRCDGELFWGNDRLHYVELCLQGRDPLPADLATTMLDRPQGSVRRRVAGRQDDTSA